MIAQKAFIFACGKNSEGDLGLGHNDGRVNLPKNVAQLDDFPVKQIAGSNTHTALMTPSGEVHVAGSTLHGKLGLEGIEKQSLNKFHVITQVAEYGTVTQVCCSDYQTLCLLSDHSILSFGGANMKDKSNV